MKIKEVKKMKKLTFDGTMQRYVLYTAKGTY